MPILGGGHPRHTFNLSSTIMLILRESQTTTTNTISETKLLANRLNPTLRAAPNPNATKARILQDHILQCGYPGRPLCPVMFANVLYEEISQD